MSIVSTTTETEIMKWHFKHIKYYAKSSKNVITLEMGKRSPTGEGNFMFQTTVAKELFSMIHRNIKNIKMAHDKKAKEDMTKQIEHIKDSHKRKEESRTRHTLRPKSLSYDVDVDINASRDRAKPKQQLSLDTFTSASTIGTVADEDLIQLEGFTIDLPDDMQDFYPSDNLESFGRNLPSRNRLSMGALIEQKLELDSVQQLTDVVYQDPATVKPVTGEYTEMNLGQQPPAPSRPQQLHVPKHVIDEYVETNLGPQQPAPSKPQQLRDPATVKHVIDDYVDMAQQQPAHSRPQQQQQGFEDSFTSGSETPHSVDPFSNVTDPFSSPARGSFYNTEDDIFQNFEQLSSPGKTSTPNNPVVHYDTPRHKTSQLVTNQFRDNPPQPPLRQQSIKRKPSSTQAEPMYTNVTDALKGLKDIQLDTQNKGANDPVPKPRTIKRRATKQQLDDMWGDIEADFKMP